MHILSTRANFNVRIICHTWFAIRTFLILVAAIRCPFCAFVKVKDYFIMDRIFFYSMFLVRNANDSFYVKGKKPRVCVTFLTKGWGNFHRRNSLFLSLHVLRDMTSSLHRSGRDRDVRSPECSSLALGEYQLTCIQRRLWCERLQRMD